MPEANLFTVNGRIIQLYDLCPQPTPSRRCVASSFLAMVCDIGYELVMLAPLAVLILAQA
ncbi:MAG: hypothetical protein R3E31_30740 [Chloroflexota bacterium]